MFEAIKQAELEEKSSSSDDDDQFPGLEGGSKGENGNGCSENEDEAPREEKIKKRALEEMEPSVSTQK